MRKQYLLLLMAHNRFELKIQVVNIEPNWITVNKENKGRLLSWSQWIKASDTRKEDKEGLALPMPKEMACYFSNSMRRCIEVTAY